VRLEITRKTDLALQALRVLAETENPVKGKDLADRIGTTAPFIPQVMKPLVDVGWVGSDRGPTGGYRLSADLTRTSVLSLIEAMEGPTVDGRCVLQGTPCPATDRCAMHDAWTRASAALLVELSKTNIIETPTHERTAS